MILPEKRDVPENKGKVYGWFRKKSPGSSPRRKPGSTRRGRDSNNWIPASAGMTNFVGFRLFTRSSILDPFEKIQFLYIMFQPFVKAPSIADFGLRISDFICFFFLSIRNPQSPIRNRNLLP